MSVDYIGNGNDDGTDFGQSATDKIGFFGLTTPIAQQTLTGAVSVTASPVTLTTDSNTVIYGFSSLDEANGIVLLVNDLRDKLIALGLTA